MTTKDDGGPAFPGTRVDKVERADTGAAEFLKFDYPGMSLRDWFAGQALAAMKEPKFLVGARETAENLREHAENAYAIADALLEARK